MDKTTGYGNAQAPACDAAASQAGACPCGEGTGGTHGPTARLPHASLAEDTLPRRSASHHGSIHAGDGAAAHADPFEGACPEEGAHAIPVLGGMPLRCLDVAGLVVDVTLMTPRGCNTKHAAGFVDEGDPSAIEERYARYRAASDVAQVVANYLRCHPRVEEVRYPGLKGDPSFAVAARTLVGGFGPWVDYLRGGTWHRVTCEPEDPKVAVMRLERELATSMPRI